MFKQLINRDVQMCLLSMLVSW